MSGIYKTCSVLNLQNNFRILSRVVNNYSTAVNSEEKIQIPKRIHRSSTDILKALSSTVGQDPTAAHYKFHDDPYLIPMSNIGKRTFAMAQESGRKAAKWILQENPHLFKHHLAEPPVKAFAPRMTYTKESEVTIDDLNNLIRDAEVSDAILVYNLLDKKSVSIPAEMKLNLLQLVCFYNNEDTLSDELIEERWFRQSTSGKERQRKTWKDNDFAELLFSDIEPKNSEHYCTIIRGMCKYFQVEKSWALYQDALQKGMKIDVTTYNSLIQVASFLKEGNELRWDLVREFLTNMAKDNLKPDVGTLNATLAAISTIGNNKLSKQYVLSTLAEFKSLNVEPSFASWYYVLITFCRERGPVSHVLIDVLNQIEGKEFKIQNIRDTFFFVTAMDICRNHLFDKDLAKRVDKLLHTGNNYDLIGDSYKESVYYRHYFALLCATEPLDVFMDTYNLLVPNIYTPEPGVMEEILKAINLNGALEYVPRIWSDMVIFDHTGRESLLVHILKIMIGNVPNPDIPSHAGLNEKFTNIAWDIWTKIEEQNETRTQRLSWTGEMLSDILQLCCKSEDIKRATLVFNKLDKEPHKILGSPTPTGLVAFAELCILNKQPSKAINCLEYCSENGFHESIEIGKSITEKLTLDEGQTSKIFNLIGKEAIVPSTSIQAQ